MTEASQTFKESSAKFEVAGVPYKRQPPPIPGMEGVEAGYRLIVVIERVKGGWNATSPMLPEVSCRGDTWQEAYNGFAGGVSLIRSNISKPIPLPVVDVDKKDIPKATDNRRVRVLAVS
jgi:hypothetical protein